MKHSDKCNDRNDNWHKPGEAPCTSDCTANTMNNTPKTIDINAKEWFDKVNGNSYFSARMTLDLGTPDEKTFVLPFQYGYGEHYIQQALALLEAEGYQKFSGTASVREAGIILRTNKQTKCLKREVKLYGTK